MLKINILTFSKEENFLQQLNVYKYSSEEYYIQENSTENIEWDLVVVYENIIKKIPVKYRYSIFISGEPPMSRVYPQEFISQFDCLITSHRKLKHTLNVLSQQALNWHYARSFQKKSYQYDFSFLEKMLVPLKNSNISVISSSKSMMPGHNRRLELLAFLHSEYDGKIDFFGKGFSEIEYKYEALDNYRFHICIENSSVEHYWTEKFADPLLAYSIPIYIGCPNIDEYFYRKGYISLDINDFQKIKSTIDEILNNPCEIYERMLPGLFESRSLLLNKYNIFDVIIEKYSFLALNIHREEIIEKVLMPVQAAKLYSFLLYKLRLLRAFYKIYLKW